MATTELEGLAEPGHELLHDAEGSDAEDCWLHTTRVLFDDRARAEEVVAGLVRRGAVPASSVSLASAEGLRAPCCDPRPGMATRATGRGAAIGAAGGLIVGVALAMVGLVDMDLATAVPLLALTWAGFLAVAGGLIGLAVSDPLDDDPLQEVEGADGSVVVTIRSLKADRLRARLSRLGGTPLDTHPPVPTDRARSAVPPTG